MTASRKNRSKSNKDDSRRNRSTSLVIGAAVAAAAVGPASLVSAPASSGAQRTPRPSPDPLSSRPVSALLSAPAALLSAAPPLGTAQSGGSLSTYPDTFAPPSAPLPPVPPSPLQQAALNNLIAVTQLRAALLSRFPSSFGGFYDNGDNSFTVLTVGDPSAIESFVGSYLGSLSGPVPKVNFAAGTQTLQSLQNAATGIASDTASWEAQGIPVIGAGVDDTRNAVLVALSGPLPSGTSLATIAAKYNVAPGALISTVMPHVVPLDRNSDTAPWNAGDQIVNTAGDGCTTGFGIHTSSAHYILSAGHCGSYKWYNTNYYAPVYNNPIGTTAVASSTPLDVQSINTPGGSSDLFWKQTSTREYVSGNVGPTSGSSVCDEGSFGFESCGTITGVNVTLYGVEDIFIVQGANPVHGDSGGPIVWPTGFGYLAQGTIDLDATNGSGPAVGGENIEAELYVLGAAVNTPSNP
jgi:hypothetical protein